MSCLLACDRVTCAEDGHGVNFIGKNKAIMCNCDHTQCQQMTHSRKQPNCKSWDGRHCRNHKSWLLSRDFWGRLCFVGHVKLLASRHGRVNHNSQNAEENQACECNDNLISVQAPNEVEEKCACPVQLLIQRLQGIVHLAKLLGLISHLLVSLALDGIGFPHLGQPQLKILFVPLLNPLGLVQCLPVLRFARARRSNRNMLAPSCTWRALQQGIALLSRFNPSGLECILLGAVLLFELLELRLQRPCFHWGDELEIPLETGLGPHVVVLDRVLFAHDLRGAICRRHDNQGGVDKLAVRAIRFISSRKRGEYTGQQIHITQTIQNALSARKEIGRMVE